MGTKERIVADVAASAARDGFALDDAQRELLDRLGALGARASDGRMRDAPTRGLYLHGAAGRGKSWIADAFFAAVPSRHKVRVHVHGFFDDLHRRLYAHLGTPGAGDRAVADIVGDARLLLFDELHVHDSGDARLLTLLLGHAFRRGLTVVTTSNYAPAELLPNPAWHHTFEPGIALIAAHMDIWHLDGPTDYRTATTDHSRGFAAGSWTRTAPSVEREPTQLTVGGRTFAVTAADAGGLVATFDQLCGAATSTIEFVHWARGFPRWTITDVPPFDRVDPAAQQRFVTLVDVLVDRGIPTRFTSRVALADFLSVASGRPDAFRMASRLRMLRDASADAVR